RTYNKDLGCVWLARISFRERLVISSADLAIGCVWFDRFAPRDTLQLLDRAISVFVLPCTKNVRFYNRSSSSMLGIGALTGATMGSKIGVSDWVTGGWTYAVLYGLVVCTGSFFASVPCLTTLDGVGMVGPLYATPLRVVIPFRSSFGLVTVLPGSLPDPEDEAMLELMNLDIIFVRLANCFCTV
nr:hypothetical protein [Tanacetum cinerariifolium]